MILRELREVVSILIEKGFYIVLLPFQLYEKDDDDSIICNMIADGISDEKLTILSDYHSWDEVVSFYKRAKISIGMRYHSLIASLIANTPMISVSYDLKNIEFMRDIDMDKFSFNTDVLKAESLINAVNELLDNYDDFKKSLEIKLNRLREEVKDIDLREAIEYCGY
jgi:polysaccharide pyruvyl transferase WcaK-like protein